MLHHKVSGFAPVSVGLGTYKSTWVNAPLYQQLLWDGLPMWARYADCTPKTDDQTYWAILSLLRLDTQAFETFLDTLMQLFHSRVLLLRGKKTARCNWGWAREDNGKILLFYSSYGSCYRSCCQLNHPFHCNVQVQLPGSWPNSKSDRIGNASGEEPLL